jgi:metal-sulfur cluster biosynthetic enzyme/ribosomal protein L22
MGPALNAELHIVEPQLRVAENEARAALDAVTGRPAVAARARLRFGPGRTCEPIARLLDQAIVQAERAGLDAERLIVTAGRAQAAEDIVRVRRKAHGKADWISSATSRVQMTLQPAGLYAAAREDEPPSASYPEPPEPDVRTVPPAVSAGPADDRAAAVHQALFEVIDPDLGVNIVDLGFVRGVAVEGRTAVITMTLTSAACPLTSVMEDQIRGCLAAQTVIGDFRVDWQWLPAWRPEDISASGREQLRAVGFTI